MKGLSLIIPARNSEKFIKNSLEEYYSNFSKKFKNCVGTTQSKSFRKIQNFGGFTDGDRGVFLANHFGAKKIILFGMDFGDRIGKFSNTKKSERKIKLMKLLMLTLSLVLLMGCLFQLGQLIPYWLLIALSM